jgi:purine-binding chemotaxis protein CheW
MSEWRDREPGLPGTERSAATSDGAEVWLFGIRLLGGRYAFEAPMVTEVVRLGPLTRLPSAPNFLPGVFTHRGEVLAVLDLAQLMGQAAVPIRLATRAAIVWCEPWKVAVVADDVEGLIALERRHLEPPPAEGGGVSEFVSAVGRDEHGTVAVLDLPRLIQAARARSVAT